MFSTYWLVKAYFIYKALAVLSHLWLFKHHFYEKKYKLSDSK